MALFVCVSPWATRDRFCPFAFVPHCPPVESLVSLLMAVADSTGQRVPVALRH